MNNKGEWYIHDGRWKLTLWHTKGKQLAFQRTHRHGKEVRVEYQARNKTYTCRLCNERSPDTMEGFISIIEWSQEDVNRI